MGVLDFLFEGKPPQSVTNYGSTVQNIPQWMSDYTQGLVARANAIAAEPYQAYSGPRVAGFTPSQQQSFDLTAANVGAWQPDVGKASDVATGVANTSPLAAASPFLASAGQKWTDPGVAQSYMNPYIQNVLNRNATLANRNLTENFLPELQNAFTSAGQFGSTRMEDLGLRGVRDISEGLNQQDLAALSDAYGQSANIFGADTGRAATLAGTAGNLTTAGGELGLGAAGQLGALGQITSQQGLRDAAALEGIGAEQQQLGQKSLDTAYQDFTAQRDYPRTTTDWMSSVIRGLPDPMATQTSQTGFAPAYQASPLAQLASTASTLYGLNSATHKRGGLAQARRHMVH